jgi:peptide/nickel transport system ATP-binding protein
MALRQGPSTVSGDLTSPERTQDTPALPLLEARGLRIESRIGGRRRTIVSGIDLTVAPGETVGIVGESGSGKSLTARALIGLLPPGVFADGAVLYDDRNVLDLPERALARLRGAEIGLIFQDPFTMLNPLRRSGRHITETLRDKRGRQLSRIRQQEEAARRLAEVGIREPSVAERYPFQLSGGMRQRVAIAAALARDPKILIADEPSTALDVTTQKEILALLKSLQQLRGMGLVLITHDLRVAFSMCDRIHVLYAGSVLEVGRASLVETEPLHPYTLGLLLSEPRGDRRLSELVAISGSVPAPDEVAAFCPFAPRCAWVKRQCTAGKTELAEAAPGRLSACIRLTEIRSEMSQTRQAAERSAHVRVASRIAEPLVAIEGLHKVFKTESKRGGSKMVIALAGVSLEVGENESVGLVGESGSGKTTLARCLVGLESPTGGRITIDGIPGGDYRSLRDSDRQRLRRTIQMIFQDPYSSLNPVRTVGSTLKEALALRGSARSASLDSEMRQLLVRVGLPASFAERKPVALSGGERQRVAIARVLAVEPKVIVCDEPVSALDVSVQAQILNLFKSLRADTGMSYLFITHDLAVVRQVVERVYVLYRGEVVEAGAVDEVLDRPTHPYTKRLVDSVPRSEAEWLRSQLQEPSFADSGDGGGK